MRAIWVIIAFLGCLLCLLAPLHGCKPRPVLTGKWVGYRKIEAAPEADQSMTKTLSKVEVRILANGKFEMFERGLPKSGRIQFSGDTAVLEITELAGQRMDRQPQTVQDEYGPIELTPQKDGTLLYRDPKVVEPPLFLERKS